MTLEEILSDLYLRLHTADEARDLIDGIMWREINAHVAAEREACATPPDRAKWYFQQVEPSGTVVARTPDGRGFVVKGGDFNSSTGRELLNAMIAALSGP